MKRLVLVITTTILLSGCVPKTYTVSQQIKGKVLDATTKKPLSGVKIASVETDAKGRFFLKAKKEFGIGTPMGGVWKLPDMTVPIAKRGYKKIYCRCESTSNDSVGCTDVTIALEPVKKSETNIMIQSTRTENFSCHTIGEVK